MYFVKRFLSSWFQICKPNETFLTSSETFIISIHGNVQRQLISKSRLTKQRRLHLLATAARGKRRPTPHAETVIVDNTYKQYNTLYNTLQPLQCHYGSELTTNRSGSHEHRLKIKDKLLVTLS